MISTFSGYFSSVLSYFGDSKPSGLTQQIGRSHYAGLSRETDKLESSSLVMSESIDKPLQSIINEMDHRSTDLGYGLGVGIKKLFAADGQDVRYSALS
jgi:hypothetical protein